MLEIISPPPQVLSISSIESDKRKPWFDSKILKIEKRYNKTDCST